MKHLELFAGIGGFRRAIELATADKSMSCKCIGFSEIDDKARRTYRAIHDVHKDEVDMNDIKAFNEKEDNITNLPDFDWLTGGFPCQTFSMMGTQAGFKDKTRGSMFFEILKILEKKRPSNVLLENVRNLMTHDNGQTLHIIVKALEDLGYTVYCSIFNTSDFDLAQTRKRILIYATFEPLAIPFSEKNVSEHYARINKNSALLHQNSVLDILEKDVPIKYYLSERVKPTIMSDGTGGYKSVSTINKMIARPLTATMHKMHRASQDNYYSMKFISENGVDDSLGLSKEDVCKLQIRKLTPREAFLLQGFTEEDCRKAQEAKLCDGSLYKQAGNAVSVNTIYAAVRFILDQK